MSEPGGKPRKNSKRAGGKPSLTCAICHRTYRAIQTPGIPSLYSICPDCRITGAGPLSGDPA